MDRRFLGICPAFAIAILALVVQMCVVAWGTIAVAATNNEPAHVVAGIYNIRFGKFDLYSVNPPLYRVLAIAPLYAFGFDTDWSRLNVRPGCRSEFAVGDDFIRKNSDRFPTQLAIARLALTPFLGVAGIFVYLWCRELGGSSWAGAIACVLWSSDPLVLANAGLVTPDLPAASLSLAANYFFSCWLKSRANKCLVLAAFLLALACLCKYSVILFTPVWLIFGLAQTVGYRGQRDAGRRNPGLRSNCGGVVLATVVFLYTLNSAFAFTGVLTKLEEFKFVSATFAGAAQGDQSFGNRFTGSWIGKLRLPVASAILSGVDLQQRDFEDFAVWSYANGEWNESGWWWYYLFALAVKIPHGHQLMTMLPFAIFLARPRHGSASILFAFAAAIFFGAVISWHDQFSHHPRYVLPAYVTFFPLAGWALERCSGIAARVSTHYGRRCIVVLACSLLLWDILSVSSVAPFFAGYFNEAAGGPANGHRLLGHSGLDWGQYSRKIEQYARLNRSDAQLLIEGRESGSSSIIPPSRLAANWPPSSTVVCSPQKYIEVLRDLTQKDKSAVHRGASGRLNHALSSREVVPPKSFAKMLRDSPSSVTIEQPEWYIFEIVPFEAGDETKNGGSHSN